MKRKRCQGGRARTAAAWRANPGKVYRALRGGLPWKTPPKRLEAFGGQKVANMSTKNEAKIGTEKVRSKDARVQSGLAELGAMAGSPP